jgi:hypothetical protein
MFPSIYEFTEEYADKVFLNEKKTLILYHDEELGKPNFYLTYKEFSFLQKDLNMSIMWDILIPILTRR